MQAEPGSLCAQAKLSLGGQASGAVFDEVDSLFLLNRLLTCIRDDDVRTPCFDRRNRCSDRRLQCFNRFDFDWAAYSVL